MKKDIVKIIGYTLFGIVCVIMYFGVFWTISISNADIKTSHNITFNADNQTKDALKYISKIKEAEMRENDLYCENKLLEQTIKFEKVMSLMREEYINNIHSIKHHYQVYCVDDDGKFKEECYN